MAVTLQSLLKHALSQPVGEIVRELMRFILKGYTL